MVLLAFCCVLGDTAAQAASMQLKPVLKAIDPSQAKLDVPPPALPPPSPNPLGRVTGAPITPRKHPALPAPSAPPPAYRPDPSPPSGAYPQASPPTGYPAAYPQSAPPGYPSFYPAPQPPAYGSYNQAPQARLDDNAFPSEDLIPEFGQALPFDKLPRNQAPPGNYGQGFSTQAPAQAYPYAPNQQLNSAEEQRVVRLEQAAFGSTYPEHDVPDRVDHLEKEVFGQTSEGTLNNRLAKLEAKFSKQGAFSQQLIR